MFEFLFIFFVIFVLWKVFKFFGKITVEVWIDDKISKNTVEIFRRQLSNRNPLLMDIVYEIVAIEKYATVEKTICQLLKIDTSTKLVCWTKMKALNMSEKQFVNFIQQ